MPHIAHLALLWYYNHKKSQRCRDITFEETPSASFSENCGATLSELAWLQPLTFDRCSGNSGIFQGRKPFDLSFDGFANVLDPTLSILH